MISSKQYVADVKEKDSVESVFRLKQHTVQNGKNGKPYANLTLADRTGEIEARIWDNVSEFSRFLENEKLVRVWGRCQMYQGRRQLVVSNLERADETKFDWNEFMPRLKVDIEGCLREMDAIIASMQDKHYRALAEAVFIGNPDVRERLRRAPAAKSMHHAYTAGLLEHMVSVVKILDLLSVHYGKRVNRDLLIIGGLFHDIGKIWELQYDSGVDYTMPGRLVGHLVMGVELIEKTIQDLGMADFPEQKKLLAKHMVLAHHGKLEYGSPKEPHVLEALIVHMVDDLDSKVNAIAEFALADEQAGEWTSINRQFNRYFYKELLKESREGN